MSPSERLNEFIRVVFEGKVSAAAKAMGIERTSLYKYVRGEKGPGTRQLDRLAEVGGNPAWIMRGEGSMFADNAAGHELRDRYGGKPTQASPAIRETPDGYRVSSSSGPERPPLRLPLFLSPVSAGAPMPADDYIEQYVDPSEYFIDNPEHTFLVRAQGRSMMYGGIHPGDLLIVDRSIEPMHGDVIIGVLNGEPLVKRLEVVKGETWLMPENHEFEPTKVRKGDRFQILGVVQHSVHRLRR